MNDFLEIARKAALLAGAEVMRLYETTVFEKKADGSPVTLADTNAHLILMEHLSTTGIAILSEEAEGVNGIPSAETTQGLASVSQTASPYPDYLWIIDPLDGTKDFLNKTGDFAVMVGLVKNGIPVLGVVYAPASEKLYYATKGGGAFLTKDGDTQKLEVPNTASGDLRCIRSVNHFTPRMKTVIEKLSAVSIPHGSVGVKAGLIAEDLGDFFFSWGNLGEWDVCAPEVILREAGGKVTDIKGAPLRYGNIDHRIEKGMLFTNGHCHEKVLEALRSTPQEG